MSADLLLFHQVRQHDDHSTPPVIHRLPEVSTRALHRSLGYDVTPVLLVPLHTTTNSTEYTNTDISLEKCVYTSYMHVRGGDQLDVIYVYTCQE